MADNYAIEGMRSALAGYSADEEKIKELYAKARERLEAERVRAEKEIAAEAKAKRDAAAADALYSERNVDNALAARGLSFSGEAAQAKINSALGLNGRLKAIDEESAKAEAEANGEYSNDLHENDLDEIEKLLALRQKKASLRADFANAAAKAKSQGDKADEESEEEEKFTPPMTAGALAGKIIKSAGSETGMIANRTQNEKAKKILDSFAKRYDLSDEYYQALLFALEANGYAPDGTGYSRGGYKTGAN